MSGNNNDSSTVLFCLGCVVHSNVKIHVPSQELFSLMKLTKVKSTFFTPPFHNVGRFGRFSHGSQRWEEALQSLWIPLCPPQTAKTNHTSKFLHVSGRKGF